LKSTARASGKDIFRILITDLNGMDLYLTCNDLITNTNK
jgi:hypothetical protein